jgi:hypothetical protein
MIGKLEGRILDSFLETIPLEFSVVDANDRVLAWNRHEGRIFKRPLAALGMDVRNCHPEKSLGKVLQIISEMKEGKRHHAEFWIDLPLGKGGEKNKVLIRYFALRGEKGEYLGCLEATQNASYFQGIKGEKRLLD